MLRINLPRGTFGLKSNFIVGGAFFFYGALLIGHGSICILYTGHFWGGANVGRASVVRGAFVAGANIASCGAIVCRDIVGGAIVGRASVVGANIGRAIVGGLTVGGAFDVGANITEQNCRVLWSNCWRRMCHGFNKLNLRVKVIVEN